MQRNDRGLVLAAQPRPYLRSSFEIVLTRMFFVSSIA